MALRDRLSIPLLPSSAAICALVIGCGSSGEDLFQGGEAGAAGGSVTADASVDSAPGTGGASGQGGTAGAAGMTATGGSAGMGGGSAGMGGGSAGMGGGSAGMGGGSAGMGGGSAGMGGGSAGMGGGSAGMGGGSAGAAGALEAGCEAQCEDNFCPGGTATNACLTCLNTVCGEIGSLYTNASDLPGYHECLAACGDADCYDGCCTAHPKACFSGKLWGGCSCGWVETDCAASCGDACSGGFMDEWCQDCVKESPCGLALYEYHNAAGAGEYSSCRNACYGDAACEQKCCSQYPVSCAARQAAVDCVCN